MRSAVSGFPDRALRFAKSLPWPASRLVFAVLIRMIRAYGRATGKLTRIRFGDVEIVAPLEHPAVGWRYHSTFNQNYVLVAKQILQKRQGLIIDVGANIGDGVAMLRGAGVDAPVLGIEGAEVWFDLLKSNTSGFSGVTLENVFLGTGEQESGLALDVKDGTSKLIKGDVGVETISLDALIARHKEHPVVMLKTDTDGFDARVLYGAKALLKEQHPVVFAEVDETLLREQGNSSSELMKYLAECGYIFLAAWDNFGRFLGSRPLSQGVADLIATRPGGPGMAYIDIAVFTEVDRDVLMNLA
jgi:FkbM family methyltransferase